MKIDKFRGWGAAGFLAFAVFLGGASGDSAGLAANSFLQSLAILLIVMTAWGQGGSLYLAQAKMLSWVVSLFGILVFISLIPSPPAFWSHLPGRDLVAAGYRLLGMELPSLPVSLAPHRSITSVLWLLPPVAIFLLVAHSSPAQRKKVPVVLIVLAALSIALGAAQLLGGTQSALRFYRITNNESPVGFFANANHLATLLLCGLPMAAYLAARGVGASMTEGQRRSSFLVSGAVAFFILIGIAIVGSLAGYGLVIPAAVASLLLFRRAAYGPLTVKWVAGAAALFVLFIAVGLTGPISQQALTDKFDERPTSRAIIAENTVMAISHLFPVGSGLGTFADVYRTFDDPKRATGSFINHAHNDYLEIVLELGLAGILLVLGFLTWFGRQALSAWRSDLEGSNLGRAASAIIVIILLHSLVDYPLRTSALSVVFAAACGMLVPPTVLPRRVHTGRQERPRHLEAD